MKRQAEGTSDLYPSCTRAAEPLVWAFLQRFWRPTDPIGVMEVLAVRASTDGGTIAVHPADRKICERIEVKRGTRLFDVLARLLDRPDVDLCVFVFEGDPHGSHTAAVVSFWKDGCFGDYDIGIAKVTVDNFATYEETKVNGH